MTTTTQFGYVGGQTRYGQFDDFLGLGHNSGVESVHFSGVTENSGTATLLAAQEDGWFELVTGTTGGNRSMVIGDRNWVPGTDGIVMEAGVALHALTSVRLFVGWTDLTTINNPLTIDSGTTVSQDATADAVGFIFSASATNSTDFYVAGAKNSTVAGPTLVTAGKFPLVADTFQALRVQVDKLGNAYFFINGNQVALQTLNTSTGQTGLLNAVTPTALLAPVVCVETTTTAAKTGYVDYIYAQKGRKG